jgi:hypothetical protein
MTQDASLRAQGKWLYTDYDSLNRPLITGTWADTHDNNYHQGLASVSITYPTPSSGDTILTQIYYDDYSWVSTGTGNFTNTASTLYNGNTSYFYTADNTTFPYPQSQTATKLTRACRPAARRM